MDGFKVRRDRYLRLKGGKAQVAKVSCARCGKTVLFYQKDGTG